MIAAAGPDSETTLGKSKSDEVRRDLIDQLYRSGTTTLFSSFAAACLLSYVLWESAAPVGLLPWFAIVVTLTLIRFIAVRLVLQRGVTVDSAAADERQFLIGATAAGVIWGCSIVLSVQLEPATELLVVPCVMAALSMSAIVSYSRSLWTFAGFVVPSVGPYAIRLVWLDGTVEPMMAGFVLFWAALLWVTARHLNRGFRNRIELSRNNERLIQSLTAARDRAESANLAKTRFLANMSHELRTPLNAIMGYSEMMSERSLGPQDFGKYETYPPIVYRSGRHLLRIVDQILDVSKLEAGAVDLSEDVIDVPQLVENAIKFVAPNADRDGVTIDWAAPDQLPYLRGDATKVRQIVLNLLSNSVKFTPAGGTVSVSVSNTTDGRMEVVVSDTGIGISPDDIEKVLVPFARMENREHLQRMRSLKPDGGFNNTGLGLPLVKLLCDAHGAEFRLSSTPNVGTTARVLFPADRLMLGENVTSLRAVS